MIETPELIKKIRAGTNKEVKLSEDGQALCVLKEDIIELLNILKKSLGFVMLADLTAVEYDDRFEVVYHLMALNDAQLLRIKVDLSKDAPSIPTAIPVWKAANVLEREVYDLMGINFEGHGELKRILCPDDFKGHPLRKDFKLEIIDRFI